MAFNGCKYLFTIENSKNNFSPFSIGEYSFAGAKNFKFSYNNNSDKTTLFLKSTAFIGSFAFYDCKNIGRIDLYNNNQDQYHRFSLGRSSFYNCNNIQEIFFHDFRSMDDIKVAIAPSVEVFNGLAQTGIIHVHQDIEPSEMRDYLALSHTVGKFYLY